jgi:anti-anti-sigma regulatory factor
LIAPGCTTISPAARDLAPTRANDRDFAVTAGADLPLAGDHFVGDGGSLRITVAADHAVMVIAGDVDEVTYSALVGILRRAAEGSGPILIDLAGVEYCDLAGLRTIVGMTRVSGHDQADPRSVELRGVPPHLMAVLRIVGWDATAGLTLHERNQGTEPA